MGLQIENRARRATQEADSNARIYGFMIRMNFSRRVFVCGSLGGFDEKLTENSKIPLESFLMGDHTVQQQCPWRLHYRLYVSKQV